MSLQLLPREEGAGITLKLPRRAQSCQSLPAGLRRAIATAALTGDACYAATTTTVQGLGMAAFLESQTCWAGQ